MRCLLSLAIAATAALPAQQPTSTPTPTSAPNVVYLMADELGYYELSCLGNPTIATPNVDRMAAEGMRFTQCLAGSSVCAPTRACFLTGKHSGHTSVRTNGGGTPLRAEEATIGTMLKAKGYATGGFGKWGCGGRGSTGVPELHGFDTFVGYYDQVHAHSYYPAYLIENSNELPLAGNHGGREGETYSHYVIWQHALQFVRDNAKAGTPFFCYLPVTPPHGMFDIPDRDPAWAQFADKPWPMEAKRYAAMVAMIDRELGELIALLRELGLEQNTLVLFSGDNGGADYFKDKQHPRGFHCANKDPKTGSEFRGNKGTLYEGGLRIPMVARWPGHVPAGVVSDHLCYFPDLLPTVAELCGATPPPDIDGISIVPTLTGHPAEQRQHDHLYWEIDGQTALRQGDWKIVQPGPKRAWELYDLATDVSEQHDVAGQYAELVATLTALAAAAHTPCVEGTFANRTLHEKDRDAKWGDKGEPAAKKAAVRNLPPEGLLPTKDWKVVHVSSESTFNGKLAANAFDGDPRTIWHTQWQGEVAKPPHELVIDLGRSCAITGFAVLARQDNGWNGTPGKCEFTVGDDSAKFGEPTLSTTFAKTKEAQAVDCTPVTGRYLRVRILTEVDGGPWAALAELGVRGS